ncbi:HpcH/HpaI aldolase family protein [Leifsonia sp. RAF41]|uniref:HpcH/HpaI aldolase family protein n=1 Tax=Leifsonia sp. RAF41 TaxID=3233056 RepID=UPI003F9899C1
MTSAGFWLTDDSTPAAEIVAELGFGFVIIDAEHGMFDLATLERYVPLLLGLGVEVFVKVLAPERGPIQQALDFGATGVIIPHVGALADARTVTAYAKYPPLGKRSITGGRNTHWAGHTNESVAAEDERTLAFPLIEEAAALEDIQAIAKLETVDGVMLGPTDLSMSRGRGMYSRTDEDFADLERVVAALGSAGKPWIFPAWTPAELTWALDRGASRVIIGTQYDSLAAGARAVKQAFEAVAQ